MPAAMPMALCPILPLVSPSISIRLSEQSTAKIASFHVRKLPQYKPCQT